MAGGCQASAHLVPRVAHTGLTASPTLTQSIPYANPTPQHLQSCAHSHTGAGGRENSQKQNPHTPTVSLRPCELHLSLPLAWADLPVASVGPTLHSPRAIADHPLPPSLPGHLADLLHPCPSALHSLWADPGGCPLLWLPGSPPSASFFLTLPLFLSFLCLPPSIGASNHRYP